jgi:uncharacterized protein (DUF952 family)
MKKTVIYLFTTLIFFTGIAIANEGTINHANKWYSDKYIICEAEIKNWPDIQKAGVYSPDSLKTLGFIHCSRATQLFFVANKFFNGTSWIFLVIDPERLTSPLKYEGTLNSNLYPHVYGPVNLDAVIGTKEIEPNSEGSYTIPKEFIAPIHKNKYQAICSIEIKNWLKALSQGEYKPDDFDAKGYIPCINFKNFHDENDFDKNHMHVVIDTRKVTSPIKLEGKSNSHLNPDIYGPLNMDAVIAVLEPVQSLLSK